MKKASPDPNGMIRVPTHSDVQTGVHGDAAILLIHASPFLACTVQASPSAPARDLSSSVTAAVTTVGAMGAFTTGLRTRAAPTLDYVTTLKNDFQDKIKPVGYSYDTQTQAQAVVTKLYADLKDLLEAEKADEGYIENNGSNAYAIRDELDDLRKVRDSIQQYFDFVSNLVDERQVAKPTVSNEILIPLDRFRQKAVSETITCKDAVTQTQTFSTMTFTAYYENTPAFDISAGAIMSLTPGRQVGVVTGPYGASPSAATIPGPCIAQTQPLSCLAVTSQSKVQFMPAAFLEWHWDWKWPAVHNGRAYHPFGYVGSFGPALGISVNPK